MVDIQKCLPVDRNTKQFRLSILNIKKNPFSNMTRNWFMQIHHPTHPIENTIDLQWCVVDDVSRIVKTLALIPSSEYYTL